MLRYPKAFTKYWIEVDLCGIMEEDDFKHEAYLAWKAGRKHGQYVERAEWHKIGCRGPGEI